jgi:hypothetical protein
MTRRIRLSLAAAVACLLGVGLLALPTTAAHASPTGCNGTLTYRRDFWQNANFQKLPEDDGAIPEVTESENTYYWYCNSFPGIANKIRPDAVRYCVTRLNSGRLSQGTTISGVFFNPFYRTLYPGGNTVDPGQYKIDMPDNGSAGDVYCGQRQGISDAIQKWMSMDNDPGLILDGHFDLRLHPDVSFEFENTTGGNFHQIHPGDDPIVDPTP